MPKKPSGESVLLLAPSLTGAGGGIEVYVRDFLEGVCAARPNARFVAVLAREKTLRRPELLSPGLRARLVVHGTERTQRFARVAEFMLRAALATATHRPSMIICGHVNFNALAHGLARIAGAKLVSLIYGIEAWNITQPSTARALRKSDRVISISNFTADKVVQTISVDRARIAVVNNAVDVERFTPGPAAADMLERLSHLPRPRLLTVCRLDASEQYKGVDVVLKTLASHKGLAGSYLIVGDGTDRARLQALATSRGVPAHFFGRASDADLVQLYRACDLFVMPSRNEGFGYVFIEAMAAGLPVVAGKIDGSVDALGAGALGLLVDPLSETEIADAITRQLSGATPTAMRDPHLLHAAMVTRFSRASFAAAVQRSLP